MATNKQEKQPKSKIDKLVQQYENEYANLLQELETKDNVKYQEAMKKLEDLAVNSQLEHNKYYNKKSFRRKFAIFGTIGSMIGTAVLGLLSFNALNLGTLVLPTTMILTTSTVAVASFVGFGLVPFLMSLSARKKAKRLDKIASKINAHYDALRVKEDPYYDLVSEESIQKNLKLGLGNLAYAENIDGEDDINTSKELTYEELAKIVKTWRFVSKDYQNNSKTKYKCRVELKQFGEKKTGAITSKVLNISKDSVEDFLEELGSLGDKKTNANKLATVKQICGKLNQIGYKTELRLVITDINNPTKKITTVYKNQEEFFKALENLQGESVLDQVIDELDNTNISQDDNQKTPKDQVNDNLNNNTEINDNNDEDDEENIK